MRTPAAHSSSRLALSLSALSLVALGCRFEIIEGSEGTEDTTETESPGDGDGDDPAGDGDGDTSSGDGDGDTDGDSDGDGDGDTEGDGDGDTSGDGDGDTSGDGDGDTSGDGDGDTSGGRIATGSGHTCQVRDGELYCWGRSNYGQLGYGNLDSIGDDEAPVAAGPVPVGVAVTAVSTGFEHTCAITSEAGLRCWGRGGGGRLGYSNTFTIGDDETPAVVFDVPLGIAAAAVDTGDFHTCAITVEGGVRCFGNGTMLGYGAGGLNIGDNETPASAGDIDLGGPAASIAVGSTSSCAVLVGGAVRCWGQGTYGILGYGNTDIVGVVDTPADAGDVDLGGLVAEVSIGRIHACARLLDGTVRCWGHPSNGRLGYANNAIIGDTETPGSVEPVAIGGLAIGIAAGFDHSCALLEGGDVRCWGQGGQGQLGYADTENIGDNETPDSVGPVDIGGPAIEIAVGRQVSCALRDNGAVYCWGLGAEGSLGRGNIESVGDDETPAAAGPALL